VREPWPLLGRAEELELVRLALTDDDSRGVVIAGTAGVGKSRLARESVAALEADAAVEWITATNATATIPFGAVAHLVGDLEVRGELDLLVTLQNSVTALAERAQAKPLVLVVDDAQHLDAAGAALVHRFVVSGMGRLVLTVRTGERSPDPIVLLWKDRLVQRLELAPLGRPEAEMLVEMALGGPVDRPSHRRLWELSSGNPLYLRELVIGAVDSESLSMADGIWSWRAQFHPSPRLTEIVGDRLERVNDAGRAVLDHLAWGEPLPFDALASICPTDAIVEVERAGLVVVDAESSARLAHPLYSEVVRAQMSTAERRAVMARLAMALAGNVSTSRTSLLRVAAWQLESGQADDPALLSEGAQIANASFDSGLAQRLARAAIDAGGGFAASLALGKALHVAGRYREAEEVLAPLEQQATTDQERANVAIARYLALTGDGGMRLEYAPVLRHAELAINDPALRAFVRVHRAILLSLAGQMDDAIALVAGDGSEELDEASAVRAVPALGAAWTSIGEMDKAVDLAQRMLEPALRRSDELPEAPFWVFATQFLALIAAGRLDEAELLRSSVEAVVSTQYTTRPDVEGHLALTRGIVALGRGQVATARRELRTAVDNLRTAGQNPLAFPLGHLTEACALAGDPGGASAASTEADECVARARTFEGFVRRVRAWAAFARGQRAIAAELAVDAATWCDQHRQITAGLVAWHDALRFGAGQESAKRVVARAPELEGRLAPCLAAHAAALSAKDPEALEAAAAGFEELGTNLLAAEAFAEASDVFRDRGLRGRTQRARARAQGLAEACEGARSPILVDLGRPTALTAREGEVASLAAEGLHANEIAERLYVSTRTVEGHLHRAYVKLGVSNRRELKRALRTRALV
jgi:DNA-binding CsgD family transcriptional regulator